jgi:hypothetical protein
MNPLEKKLYLLSRLKEGSEIKLYITTIIGLGLRLGEIFTVKRLLNGSPINVIIESNDTGLLQQVGLAEIESIMSKPTVPNQYKQTIAELVR